MLIEKISRIQGKLPIITTDKTVDFTTQQRRIKYNFATLENITQNIYPLLAEEKLAYTVEIKIDKLIARIQDAESEQELKSIIQINTNQDPKTVAATISYYRRYLLTTMIGAATSEDQQIENQPPPRPIPRTEIQAPAEKPKRTPLEKIINQINKTQTPQELNQLFDNLPPELKDNQQIIKIAGRRIEELQRKEEPF